MNKAPFKRYIATIVIDVGVTISLRMKLDFIRFVIFTFSPEKLGILLICLPKKIHGGSFNVDKVDLGPRKSDERKPESVILLIFSAGSENMKPQYLIFKGFVTNFSDSRGGKKIGK